MADEHFDNIDISALLRSYRDDSRHSLKELFDLKLKELDISETQALEAMKIQSRALKAMLTGDSSRVDVLSLLKLAAFLEIPQTEAVTLYLDSLKNPNQEKIQGLEKRKFILKNFDVNELKKEGIIENASDFDAIEEKLVKIFNYDSIFDYRSEVLNPLYSSSKLHVDNSMCDYWIEFSRRVFRKINNPLRFDRQALINYFPTIRWHSMNVENGLWEVVRTLYRIGVTVMYLPKFKKLHVRGATFSVNGKPCIVLTDYRRFYATLWFSLIHELHHVLFDWDDILINSFHISISDKADLYTQTEVEDVADKFARDYLFSEQKMKEILPHINNSFLVREYARLNHVHESIPYTFWAYETNNWGKLQQLSPPIDECLGIVKDITFKMTMSEIAEFNDNQLYKRK